jgi:dolichol-phosphate mannosyltransferase
LNQVERIFIALPAFNEEAAIAALLEHILAMTEAAPHPATVLVVDDGSTDGTAQEVRKFAGRGVILLVQHGKNRGLHEAVRTGMLAALDRAGPNDVLVTLDADNTHHPELIPRMVAAVEQGADVVIASRFAPGGKMIGAPFIRHVYSYGAAAILRLRFPMRGVRDYTCGYRVYRMSILRRAFDKWGREFVNVPGFSCMLDILIRLRSLEARVAEVPLVLRYDLKQSPSKLRVLRTIRNTIGLVAARDRR